MLHVSVAREGQLEHRAVAAVSAANQNGSCARTQRANTAALFLAPAEQSMLQQPFSSTFTTQPASASATRARPKHRRHHQAVSAASAGGVPAAIPSVPHPGTSAFPWLFVVLGLVVATALGSPVARRRFAHPRLAGARAGAVGVADAGAVGTMAAGAVAAGAMAAGAVAERPPREAEHDPAAALARGSRLERHGDVEGALAAYRQADVGGIAAGATNLGALLEQQGDVEGALAAYRRADARGDGNGSFNLGCLLAERGDVSGAIAALGRADERGDAAGASNLGVLLEQTGDLDGALAAYRRADERGDANGSFNLGLLLAGRGDLDGAAEAFRRAGERGDPTVADRAHAALTELRENGSR